MRFRLVVDGEPHEIEVEVRDASCVVRVDDAVYRTRVESTEGGIEVRIGKRRHEIRFEGDTIFADGDAHRVAVDAVREVEPGAATAGRSASGADVEVRPPMPGRIVRVAISEGMRVRRGQTLVVLEAMKMQNDVPAPADGIVRDVRVREGESIPGDRVIALLRTV